MLHLIKAAAHLICCSFVFLNVLSFHAQAQGDLLVMPKRVLFEGNKRSENLNLSNIGKDSATFMISFIQVRMKEDGVFETITQPDSGQNFADPFLRIFPRTVTLAPNEAQTVKVQLTKQGEMKPGEYRSHLYLRAVPKVQPLGDTKPDDASGISVKIVPVFGLSIPVIARSGETKAAVKISNVALNVEQDTLTVLRMTLNRTGNMSVYGDIVINHVDLQGKITRVGYVKGLAVYTPTASRNCSIVLTKPNGLDLHRGKLRLTYSDHSAKATVYAEQEFNLNSTASN
ncbi:MAG: molecular chaperone [Segetibacter sp.]|nr:molecular chaperone [Segetibacter sp.]